MIPKTEPRHTENLLENVPERREALAAEVERFWRHVFGEERGLLHVWTAKRDGHAIDERTISSANYNYPNAAETAAAWALDKAEEDREVYFCTHLLNSAKRRKENAAAVRCLWGELDGGNIPNGSLKPSAVVCSSPGRYHVYWRLTDAIPPRIAESLNRRIAKEIGADASGFDLTQLLRVPFTRNNKYPARPVVSITHLDDALYYSPRKLEETLPAAEEPRKAREERQAGEDKDAEPPVLLDAAALAAWRGENPKAKGDGTGELDRSGSLLKIGRVLYDAGANRRVVVEALAERDAALGWRKYTDRRDAAERYGELFDELEKNGRNRVLRVIPGGAEDREEEAAKDGEEAEAAERERWPEIDKAAYRGVFGKVVDAIDPHTEGDPVAVLFSVLVAFGNAVGRGPYVQIGAAKHRTNLYAGLTGATSKGRKGSSWYPVKDIMHTADRVWSEERIASGLSSGEGLIAEVRDPVLASDGDGGTKTVDTGVSDKRLLVMEGELSQALKVMKREGNTLSPVLRNAWDGETLRTMVKNAPHRATDPHVSILGHITRSELTKHLTETEMANGLANRFLWPLVRRSKSLPFGGDWHTVDVAEISRAMRSALEWARSPFRMTWAEDAKDVWREAYERMSKDQGGLFGAVTARAEAQALRLAMVYALAERSEQIRQAHVVSALAVWDYAEESARLIFGNALGDAEADKVLAALKVTGADGMTRSEIRDLFGRNKGRDDLDRIQKTLIDAKRIRVSRASEDGSKKPVERWFAS